jgi:hypothetical protein
MELIKQIITLFNTCFIKEVKIDVLPLTKENLQKHNESFSTCSKSTSPKLK